MRSEEELRKAEQRVQDTEPCQGLKNQVRGDDEIQWVARRNLRTAWLNLILHKLKMMTSTLVAGAFVAVFVAGFTGSMALGVLSFLAVGIGIPGGLFAWKYYELKNTIIEYAGTNERFIEYRNTPSETRTRSAPIERTKSAKFRQDRWDKLLGTGNIYIKSVRGADNIRVKDVPDSEAVHRLAQDQIAEAAQVDDVGGLRQGRAR